jgi:hypothetical protein
MEYDRDLNACINIAHRVMSSVGWVWGEPPEPACATELRAPGERWKLPTLVVESVNFAPSVSCSAADIEDAPRPSWGLLIPTTFLPSNLWQSTRQTISSGEPSPTVIVDSIG